MALQGENTSKPPVQPKGPKVTHKYIVSPEGQVDYTHTTDLPHDHPAALALKPPPPRAPAEILPGGMEPPPQAVQPRQSILPAGQRLGKNPQLPQIPLGAYTDPEFEAEKAGLESTFRQKYLDILKQLGWTDENGNVIQGTAEIGYGREMDDLDRAIAMAEEGVNNQSVRSGTFLSGRRAENLANATYDERQRESRLTSDLPGQLADLYNQALGLVSNYGIDLNKLLAAAAGRRVANPNENAPPPVVNPPAVETEPSSGGTGVPWPAADPWMNTVPGLVTSSTGWQVDPRTGEWVWIGTGGPKRPPGTHGGVGD